MDRHDRARAGADPLGLGLTHTPPPRLPMPRWQRLVARSTHYLLYLLADRDAACGWLYTSRTGYPVVYLKLWQLPDLVQRISNWRTYWSRFTVIWLGAAVAGGAAQRRGTEASFIDHDSTLRRMLAWRRSDQTRKQRNGTIVGDDSMRFDAAGGLRGGAPPAPPASMWCKAPSLPPSGRRTTGGCGLQDALAATSTTIRLCQPRPRQPSSDYRQP